MSTDIEYYTDTPSRSESSPTQQKERLMKIKSRKIKKTMTLPDPRPPPAEPERKVYDTVFVCYDDTKIIFGKLKGKNHSILKQKEWANYCEWIIKQGEDFKFQGTRVYIIDNVNLE